MSTIPELHNPLVNDFTERILVLGEEGEGTEGVQDEYVLV
jgi:hypothetical protein